MSYGSYKQSIMWVEQKTVDSNYTVNLGIERIYPLTHLQEGILYHYISKETKQYVSQDVFLINQNINSNILADVFEYVLKKYPILSTRIIYEKLNVPVQIILSKCDNSFNSYINDIGYNDKLITEAKNKELKQIDNLVKNSLFNLCQVKFNDRDSNDEKLSPQSMDTTDRGSGEIV